MISSRVAALIVVLVLSGVVGSGASSLVWAFGSAASFSVLVEEESSGVRFSVEGENVSAMHAQVLGLDGRTLFDSGWIARQTVTWPMISQTGRPVASGIYLYVITLRDQGGQEQRRLGKLALVYGKEPAFTVSSVGQLAGIEPAAAQFPLPNGTIWRLRTGVDHSDTVRIQRKAARLPGQPPTNFENLFQLEADGKLRLKELCLGPHFAPVTNSNPDNLDNGGDCRSSWTSGGSTSNGWMDDGTVVRLENATDKVGVGTTNPIAKLEAVDSTGGIAILGTGDSRAIIGRLGNTSCPLAPYAVGGCGGSVSGAGGVVGRAGPGGIGVLGDSDARGVIGTRGQTSCAGTYAVGGCSADATAIFARTDTGNIFLGQAPAGTNQVRIDNTGKGFFNGGTQTGGADFAESMRTTDDPSTLQPGDVLIIDPQNPRTVKKSTGANSRLVAGVYSTKPSVLSIADHHIDDSLDGEVPMAVVGIVPTKVTAENGPIHIGDLVVTSSTPGYAMHAPDNPAPGTILGKALGNLESDKGVIEVLVMLR